MSLAISTAKADITPPVGTPLAGQGVDSPRLATGANTPLYARCTILWDSGWPNVIVTCDTLAIPRSLNVAIRALVEPLGPPGMPIGHEDLVLTATHTHNGGAVTGELDPYIAYNVAPGSAADGAIQAYTAQLQAAVVSCVKAALAAPQTPCTLDYQTTSQLFSSNREGLPYVETVVPVLCARDAGGHLLAVLFGYGCHPVSGGVQTVADGDYPSAACAWLEAQQPGVFAQFLLGAAGDQNPVGDWSLSYAQQLGQGLGAAVLAAAARPGRTLTGPIGTAYKDLTIPLDINATPGNLAAVRADYVARQANMALPGYYRRHAQAMITQIDAHSFATSINLPVAVWTLQGSPALNLALVGGEIVAGYAVYLRDTHGGADGIWPMGYANEQPCYIPSNELLTGGGIHYACGWDSDYPGIAGGAMTVYGWLGHFKVPPCPASVDVEQILLGALGGML
jgi:hypothetical protein